MLDSPYAVLILTTMIDVTVENLPYRSTLRERVQLAPGVWQLRFERPMPANSAIAPWHFTAGQYTTLGLPHFADTPVRPYSIASAPDLDHIDLHIRDSGHGLSHRAIRTLQIGDSAALGQPAGSCVPENAQGRPLLLLAGGVGIAPMVSIASARKPAAPPCHLYWGVAEHNQLYLHSFWQAMQASGQLAGYHAVVENHAPDLRHGYIGPAVIHDLPDLSRFAIYLAGPAAMVAATLPLLRAHGAQKEYIFGDGITV